MAERYSRKDAEKAFARLASTLGKEWAHEYGAVFAGKYWESTAVGTLWSHDLENKARVGVWTLDYNPTYGGFVIEEIANAGGGVSQPFGPQRRTAREFCDAVRFALDALAVLDKVSA